MASPQKETKPVKPQRGKKQEPIPVEPPKPVITPLQKIQMMLSYGELEEGLADKPFFRFIPASREVTQRLIIRAANAKSDKEFLNMIK